MGQKGSGSTNQVQNTAQTYNANPAVAAAGTQAIGMAQNAASQPFQMPVAPVAGFSNDQQGAFQNIRNAQGMALPYMNTAASYFSPEGAQQFFNPYAANVMAGMNDVFGQQRSGLEGNLVNAAGGVGADRIGVGQAELGKQQGLAAGQTLSGLYSGAVQQAQNAGYGIGALGTQAQNSVLQGAQAQLGAGELQQRLDQMQLNAPYQNKLAQLAYPYQNAQYLAGIAGGLAPALGGSTFGNQNGQTTPPQPSMLSQVMGVGTAGAGLYGAFGGFNGSGSGKGGNAGTINMGDLGGGTGGITSGGYAEGGEVGEEETPHIPGNPSNDALMPIPYMPLHGGAGHSAPLTGGVTFQQPQQQKQDDSGGGIGSVLGAVAKIAPLFALKDGGVAGYADGQEVTGGDSESEHFSPGKILRDAYEGNYGPRMWNAITGAFSSPAAATPTNAPNFTDRFGTPPVATPTIADAGNNRQIGTDKLIMGMTEPYRLNAPGTRPTGNPKNMPNGTSAGEAEDAAPAPYVNRETAPREVMRGMMPQASQPYPDALERGPGAVATRSPWMALVNAGATMAATPGPLGVSLGKGMLAGTKSLDDQRKELQSEQGINQKAQALYQTAKAELDKYNKMTPYEAASVQARNKEIDQANVPGVVGDPKLYMRARQMAATEVNRELANNPSLALNLKPEDIEARIAARARSIMTGAGGAGPAPAAAAPGSTSQSAVPDPGDGRRQKGMWYIGPSGKPQQWQ